MYRQTDTVLLKTGVPFFLADIAIKIWCNYMPPETEYLFEHGREGTGYPYISYMKPGRDLYFRVSGGMKVMDHDSALSWKGTSFEIEFGAIKKDSLRDIVRKLANELK